MQYIRRAEERGTANFGWLESKHSFSFGNYHDPKHMGVSALRVINDDLVMPGQGFGTHGHKDMEIISYVIEGSLKHEDNTGNSYVVPAGDVQRMSAGRGVMHSEFNASSTDKVTFLQIWIHPNVSGIEPSYEQKSFPVRPGLTPLVSPKKDDGALHINQDASIFRLVLQTGETHTFTANNRMGYLHIVKGSLSCDGQDFAHGDAFALNPGEVVELTASSNLEALWFDLPKMN